MTKTEVQQFRADFQKAVAQLENQYGVSIGLGTIRFDQDGLRATMKAEKGEKVERLSKDDFYVGQTVGINHKKVNPKDQFRIVKIMTKNIKVEKLNGVGLFTVSPGLLVKK